MERKSDYLLQAQVAYFDFDLLYSDKLDLNAAPSNYAQLSFFQERQGEFYKNYIECMRSAGGRQCESIRGFSGLLEAYKTFEPLVAPILDFTQSAPVSERKKNAFGFGGYTAGFLFERNNKEYVVKVSHEFPCPVFEERLLVGIQCAGWSRFEQIVAAEFSQSIAIAERMYGQQLKFIDPETLSAITHQQLYELLDEIIIFANDENLFVEVDGNNIFYDPNRGFGVIDCVLWTGREWDEYFGGENDENPEYYQVGSVVRLLCGELSYLKPNANLLLKLQEVLHEPVISECLGRREVKELSTHIDHTLLALEQ